MGEAGIDTDPKKILACRFGSLILTVVSYIAMFVLEAAEFPSSWGFALLPPVPGYELT